MAKKLVIFGNGLGMALDPIHFNLKNAMENVWDCDTRLDNAAKDAVGALKGINAHTGPLSEDDLLSTQIALNFLTAFRQTLGEDAEKLWFTEPAQQYPETLRKYVFEVAHELYNYTIPSEKMETWREFLSAFVKYIAETRSHVATLNYDDLLYEPIVGGISVDGKLVKLSRKDAASTNKAPYLRDGFLNGSYQPSSYSLQGDCGYYLHLHGTPLFATKHSTSTKLNRNQVGFSTNTQKRHIVLANRIDKETIIAGSPILKDYWDKRLPKCITEATEIILFGYSGEDTHLNELIKEHHANGIRIVEWSGQGTGEGRQSYWDNIFYPIGNDDDVVDGSTYGYGNNSDKKSVNLVRLPDVLSFSDWGAN